MKKILSLFAVLALTCSMYATEVTVTKTVQALKDELGWSAGGATYPDFVFSEAISIDSKATNNGAVYSGTPIYWRCYQTRSNGQFTIKANDGCVIKSVKFAYSRKNNGTLAWKSGSSLLETDRLIQNTAYEINAQSVTIYTGSTGTNTDGQVNITQFTITYDDPNVICEKFSGITRDKAASVDTKWQGDLAEWSIICARRKESDALVDGTRATWTSASAYMKMTAEGGIKHLCFNWSQMATAAADYEIKMGVAMGTYDSTSIATTASTGVMKTFDYEIACKENALLILTNASDVDPANKSDRVEFGNIIITPYLYFNVPNHKDTIDFATVQSYNLGAVLINNTGADPTYEILSNSTGSACEITNGVMDLSDVISEGDIQVKASWNEGKVYTTMTLHVTYNPTPEAGHYFEETFAAMTISNKYGSQSVVGDSAVFGTWNFVASRRGSGDGKEFRLNSKNAAAVSSADELEGGIKDVYFTWRIAAGADNPVNLAFSMMAIDEDTVTAEMTNIPVAAVESHPSVVHLNVEKNAQFKLEILTSKTSQVSLYSPLKFVPYLLFTAPRHETTIDISDVPSYDLSTELINNTGVTPDYEIVSNTTGSACAISGNVMDLSDATSNGDIQVKAKWNEGKVFTTLTIHVKTIKVTVEDAEVAINGTYTPTIVVKKAGVVVTDPAVTYSSSNTSVATVNPDGKTFTLVGAGTTTITASLTSGDQTTSTLTVTAVAPADGTFWKETFSNMETGSSYNTGRTKIVGDSTIYTWYCQNYQHDEDNDKVDGELGVRMRYNTTPSNYMEFDGNQEGGIKDLYFKWRLPGNSAYNVLYNVEVYRDDNLLVERTIDIKNVPSKQVKECQQKLNVKQNAKLKIHVLNGGSSMIFGPISVTPYLLYQKKFIEKKLSDCEGQTFKNNTLIDNTSGCGGTIYYKSSDESVATVTNSGDVSVKKASSDTITITAIWKTSETDSVTTSYRLKINDREKRLSSFAKSSVSVKVGETPVNEIDGKDIATATITYSSEDEHVAKVEDNVVKVVGIGETTITADIAQTPIYLAEKISYKLKVTPKESAEDILVETFTGVKTSELAWSGDLKKYGITWTRSDNVQRRAIDKIDGKQGTWMMQSKYITSNDAIEGGVKYFYARWIQPSKEPGATLRVGLYLDDETEAAPATGDSYYNEGGTPLEDSIFTYAANPKCDRNAKLTFKNISSVTEGREEEGRIIFDQFNIVPYLFYTQKADTLKAVDYPSGVTYKNENLINNTDGVGSISYSVLGENASSIATVDDEGKVSIIGEGLVTIQAKWSNVTTTYTLLVLGNQYQLTWDGDGGELTGGTPAGLVTAGDALEAPTAVKVGYKHTGWDPEVPAVMPENDFTATATYTAKQCNITLKSNYEGGEEDIKFVATYGETSPVAGQTLFTRPGYSINRGYWKDPETEGTGERLVNSTGKFTTSVSGYTDAQQNWIRDAEEDIALYAHWVPDTFKITYANMTGATNFDGAPKKYTIVTPTIVLGTPTKTGYTFAGWKAKNAEGAEVTEIALGSMGDTTLYATWTANKTTVHFMANGGDATATFDTVVEYGTRVPILQAAEVQSKLTRENYTFNNYWTEEEDGLRMTNVVGSGKLYFISGAREGYLDAEGKWIKDGGEATFYAHWTLSTLEIKEEVDNAALLNQYNGKTMDVKLTRSNLVAGLWNSLCLPFDINKTDLGTARVVEMTGAELNGETIEVSFADVTSDELTAGTPYLVKPEAAVELTTFDQKTIVANPTTIHNNDLIELAGIYSPFAMTANDKTKLFLAQPDGQGNNLFFASVDGNLKGMRAYFNLLPQTSGAPIRLGRMVIQEPTTPTDMETPSLSGEGRGEAQKMIIDGKLVIMREGVCYDVNGQIVK